MASDLVPKAEVCFLRGWPPLVLWLGEGCVLERGWEGALSWLLWWGGRPTLLFLLSPDSENQGIRYRWHPCSLFMIRVKVPGSSFMLCLGPGPPSLLHLTRANAEKPYAGDTLPRLVRRPVAASKLGEFLPGLSSSFSLSPKCHFPGSHLGCPGTGYPAWFRVTW